MSVLLLFTVHYNLNTVSTQMKPEVIELYSKYKSGLDSMVQMLGTYTCKRKTQRWPFYFFFNILDIAVLSTHIIYTSFHKSKKTAARRGKLHLLSNELHHNEIIWRCNNQSVTAQMINRNAITDMLGGQLTMETTAVASTLSPSGPAENK